MYRIYLYEGISTDPVKRWTYAYDHLAWKSFEMKCRDLRTDLPGAIELTYNNIRISFFRTDKTWSGNRLDNASLLWTDNEPLYDCASDPESEIAIAQK
jgi:hypothetical protein